MIFLKILHHTLTECTPDEYVEMLRDVIVADADPANVILLEIEPEKQKTRVDFAATEKLTWSNRSLHLRCN